MILTHEKIANLVESIIWQALRWLLILQAKISQNVKWHFITGQLCKK